MVLCVPSPVPSKEAASIEGGSFEGGNLEDGGTCEGGCLEGSTLEDGSLEGGRSNSQTFETPPELFTRCPFERRTPGGG